MRLGHTRTAAVAAQIRSEWRAFRRLFALVLGALALAAAAPVLAQVVPGGTPTPPAGVFSMPRRITVRDSTMPKEPRAGSALARLQMTCDTNGPGGCPAWNTQAGSSQLPAPYGDFETEAEGDSRYGCTAAWWGPYDKLVYPNGDGLAHTHVGFGNVMGNKISDVSLLPYTGNSTCVGGILNRTGYWVPAPVYSCEAEDTGCDHARNGEYQTIFVFQVYYKTAGLRGNYIARWFYVGTQGFAFNVQPGGLNARFGIGSTWTQKTLPMGRYACDSSTFDGVDPAPGQTKQCQLYATGERHVMQWFPERHRMIVNDPNNTTLANVDVACMQHNPGGSDEVTSGSYRTPPPPSSITPGKRCDLLRVLIAAPNCWDGINIDSPGHQAHMAYGFDGYDCAANMVPVPSHSTIFYIRVKTAADLPFIRVSSDYPASSGYPAFSTIHFDRIEGFARDGSLTPFGLDFPTTLMNGCLYPGYDCHGALIGSPLNDGKYYTAY